MEQYEYRHNLTVGHAAGTVAMTLSRHLNGMFFRSCGEDAIREYLNTIPNVTNFRDEHVQFGGAGITVVDIG